MRYQELLERDLRDTKQKLQDLIDHPETDESVRLVARDKLDAMQSRFDTFQPINIDDVIKAQTRPKPKSKLVAPKPKSFVPPQV